MLREVELNPQEPEFLFAHFSETAHNRNRNRVVQVICMFNRVGDPPSSLLLYNAVHQVDVRQSTPDTMVTLMLGHGFFSSSTWVGAVCVSLFTFRSEKSQLL